MAAEATPWPTRDSPAARTEVHQPRNVSQEWQGVRTPVWFAGESEQGVPEKLYVYSTGDSGKAKRIRNNPRVRVAPCDVRGKLLGEWIDAVATIVSARNGTRHEAAEQEILPWRQILGFFSLFSRQKRVVL